jgi:hypothetical protein
MPSLGVPAALVVIAVVAAPMLALMVVLRPFEDSSEERDIPLDAVSPLLPAKVFAVFRDYFPSPGSIKKLYYLTRSATTASAEEWGKLEKLGDSFPPPPKVGGWGTRVYYLFKSKGEHGVCVPFSPI